MHILSYRIYGVLYNECSDATKAAILISVVNIIFALMLVVEC
jgi:hypothetical protein